MFEGFAAKVASSKRTPKPKKSVKIKTPKARPVKSKLVKAPAIKRDKITGGTGIGTRTGDANVVVLPPPPPMPTRRTPTDVFTQTPQQPKTTTFDKILALAATIEQIRAQRDVSISQGNTQQADFQTAELMQREQELSRARNGSGNGAGIDNALSGVTDFVKENIVLVGILGVGLVLYKMQPTGKSIR